MKVFFCKRCNTELRREEENKTNNYSEHYESGPCQYCPSLNTPEERLLAAVFGSPLEKR